MPSFICARTGCSWEMLPHDFPAYSTVYYYFRRWHKRGRGEQINQLLREQIRMKQGKYPQATAAIVDSQEGSNDRKKGSQCVGRLCRLEASGVEVSGNDCGKLVKGRKRHIVVDTQGLLMSVVGNRCQCFRTVRDNNSIVRRVL